MSSGQGQQRGPPGPPGPPGPGQGRNPNGGNIPEYPLPQVLQFSRQPGLTSEQRRQQYEAELRAFQARHGAAQRTPPPPYHPNPPRRARPAPNMDDDNNNNNNNSDSGSDGGHEEPNGFTLDVNSALQIRGNGSIIGFTPVNAAEVARDTVRHLHESGYLQIDPREAQGRRRGQFQININSGVTVIGNQNIVGNGLDEVTRQARIQRERGQLNVPGAGQPPRRIIDGVLQPPGNNGQQAGRGRGRGQAPQGQAPQGQAPGAGAGRSAGAGRGSGQGPWPLGPGGSPRLTQPGPEIRPPGQGNNGNPT